MRQDDIYEKNFGYIADELVRQFEVEKESFNKLDTKAQFILGLVGVIFGYLFTKKELLVLPCYIDTWVKLVYCFGLLLIFISGIFAYLCYKGKSYQYGIDKEQLIAIYRNDGTKNIKQIVARGIYDANKSNKSIISLKSVLFEWSMLALFIGILFLILSQAIIANV